MRMYKCQMYGSVGRGGRGAVKRARARQRHPAGSTHTDQNNSGLIVWRPVALPPAAPRPFAALPCTCKRPGHRLAHICRQSPQTQGAARRAAAMWRVRAADSAAP